MRSGLGWLESFGSLRHPEQLWVPTGVRCGLGIAAEEQRDELIMCSTTIIKDYREGKLTNNNKTLTFKIKLTITFKTFILKIKTNSKY